MHPKRTFAALAAGALLATGVAACGSDGDETTTAAAAPNAAQAASLQAVKDYLLQHTRELSTDVGTIQQNAVAYDKLAASVDYDYAKLLATKRPEVKQLVEAGQKAFAAANPAYEQMEGVVAGVPSLADYDVQIDAGSDASDPTNAVSFSVKTDDGRTFKQPGNYNYLVETTVFGTEPKFAAKGVTPDLDGDGKVEFGEAVPDARFYKAAATQFKQMADELNADAEKYQPTLQDAMTALVVMTPTMSEYFDAWKNSRFIEGSKSKEKAFVVASRLQDIADILGGLVLVYDNVQPEIAKVDGAQAAQTGQDLVALRDFAAQLRDAERGGKTFTASDADTLGGQAQDRAEAIAGQVSQAAGSLNIQLET